MSTLLFVFEHGRGNFGTGREHGAATLAGSGADYVCSFRSTGNHAILAPPDMPQSELAGLLHEATGRPCTARTAQELDNVLPALDARSPPAPEPGVRWTPGLAFAIAGPTTSGDLTTTEWAHLHRLSADIVGVYRRDMVTSSGRLDSTRRHGGWGAVSVDIARQIGGQWTACSASTAIGLRRRAAQRSPQSMPHPSSHG